jgi:hypothetical protein
MSIYFQSIFISIVYFIVKFIEMRFLEKEAKPLKLLVKDTLFVFFSVIVGGFLLDQLKPMIQSGGGEAAIPTVFTDNPAF